MKILSNLYSGQKAMPWAVLSLVLSIFIFAPYSFAGGDHAHHDTQASSALPPNLTVYKSATCGCCKKWINHVEDNGISVKYKNIDNMALIKNKHAINQKFQSCHTGISQDGYVFEGHVPARYIKQFLKEKPNHAIGLAVPAMPVGSPGMEYHNKFMPYEVLQLNEDGSSQVYAKINNAFQQ